MQATIEKRAERRTMPRKVEANRAAVALAAADLKVAEVLPAAEVPAEVSYSLDNALIILRRHPPAGRAPTQSHQLHCSKDQVHSRIADCVNNPSSDGFWLL